MRRFKYNEEKLTDKDMSVLRETERTQQQRDRKRGTVRDYSLQHRVEVRWDLNEEAERDRMFMLIVDGAECIIDAEELLRYLRWV